MQADVGAIADEGDERALYWTSSRDLMPTKLRRRLNNLEAMFTDRSEHAKYSPQWFEYWKLRIEALMKRTAGANHPLIPVEAIRAVMMRPE